MGRNLITGGLGGIGAYLARQLVEDGEDVVLFQRRILPPPGKEDLKGKTKIISGDVSNLVQVMEAVKNNNIDCIYHTAVLLVRDCEENPSRGYEINVGGTVNVLEAARILGVPYVGFIGSGMIYGSVPPKKIFADTVQQPTTMYATTKLCSEVLGVYYSRRYGTNFRGIRLALVIGPGRFNSPGYGDYGGAIENAVLGKPFTVTTDPSNPVSVIYVKDVVRALISLKKADKAKLRQQVYNIHGFTTTMRQEAESIKKYIPNAKIKFEQDKSEAMRNAARALSYELDDTAAREDFGWQPRYLLDEMVEDFVKEVKAGRAG